MLEVSTCSLHLVHISSLGEDSHHEGRRLDHTRYERVRHSTYRCEGFRADQEFSKPIITSHFPSHPPSYPSVCIDAFNHAAKSQLSEPSSSSSRATELDPVLWANTLSKTGTNGTGHGMGMGGTGICHLQREGLRFLVPVGQEGE